MNGSRNNRLARNVCTCERALSQSELNTELRKREEQAKEKRKEGWVATNGSIASPDDSEVSATRDAKRFKLRDNDLAMQISMLHRRAPNKHTRITERRAAERWSCSRVSLRLARRPSRTPLIRILIASLFPRSSRVPRVNPRAGRSLETRFVRLIAPGNGIISILRRGISTRRRSNVVKLHAQVRSWIAVSAVSGTINYCRNCPIFRFYLIIPNPYHANAAQPTALKCGFCLDDRAVLLPLSGHRSAAIVSQLAPRD